MSASTTGEIVLRTGNADSPASNWAKRTMWTGDNPDIMRGMNSGCVDLIYLGLPFKKHSPNSCKDSTPSYPYG